MAWRPLHAHIHLPNAGQQQQLSGWLVPSGRKCDYIRKYTWVYGFISLIVLFKLRPEGLGVMNTGKWMVTWTSLSLTGKCPSRPACPHIYVFRLPNIYLSPPAGPGRRTHHTGPLVTPGAWMHGQGGFPRPGPAGGAREPPGNERRKQWRAHCSMYCHWLVASVC